jgi:hypothetical protein
MLVATILSYSNDVSSAAANSCGSSLNASSYLPKSASASVSVDRCRKRCEQCVCIRWSSDGALSLLIFDFCLQLACFSVVPLVTDAATRRYGIAVATSSVSDSRSAPSCEFRESKCEITETAVGGPLRAGSVGMKILSTTDLSRRRRVRG